MEELDAMRAFTSVVTFGSYAAAGRQLGLTRSAVSKGVKELEHILGARLLKRTTRRVSPTETGIAYNDRCLEILAQIEETESQISQLHDEPRGVLKVNAPLSFGALHLGAAVAQFMRSYPDLKIELALNDRFIDPLDEGVDVTIRIAVLQDANLIARRLAPARRLLVASPKYLADYGTPSMPGDLLDHRCLNFGHTTALQKWQLTSNGETLSVPIGSTFCSNNGDVLRTAALTGNGITKLPTFLIGPDVKAGRLAIILPEYPPTDLGIFALYAPNKYLAAKVRLFIDFLIERFGPAPEWDQLN